MLGSFFLVILSLDWNHALLTSILASPCAIFTVSQQVATPLHWVGSKHFVENIQFPMFMVWEQVFHRSP